MQSRWRLRLASGGGLPVAKTLVTAGSWEILLDDILELAEKMQEGAGGQRRDVQLAVCERECHDQCIIDMGLGVREALRHMARRVFHWCRQLS